MLTLIQVRAAVRTLMYIKLEQLFQAHHATLVCWPPHNTISRVNL